MSELSHLGGGGYARDRTSVSEERSLGDTLHSSAEQTEAAADMHHRAGAASSNLNAGAGGGESSVSVPSAAGPPVSRALNLELSDGAADVSALQGSGLGNLQNDTALERGEQARDEASAALATASQRDSAGRRSHSGGRSASSREASISRRSARTTTAARYGDSLYFEPNGEFYISEHGEVFGAMRAAKPAPTDESMTRLTELVDRAVDNWRTYTGGYDVTPGFVRRAKEAVEVAALRVSSLAAEYESCMRQRKKLVADIGHARDAIQQLLKGPGSAAERREPQVKQHDRLSAQLTEILLEDIRIREDYELVVRLRDKATRAYIQAADVVPSFGKHGVPPLSEQAHRGLGYEVSDALRVPLTAPSLAVPRFQTASVWENGASPAPTTTTRAPTSRHSATNMVDLSEGAPGAAYGGATVATTSVGGSGPRMKIDRWTDMTKIRTKLRQLRQMISGHPEALQRQYLCQALPADQIVMVSVRHADGVTRQADVCTLDYPQMVRALLSKFDTASDRAAAKVKLLHLKLTRPVTEQQMSDYPTYFHDNVFWPLLESSRKGDNVQDDSEAAETFMNSLPARLQTEVHGVLRVMNIHEEDKTTQQYLEAASVLRREAGALATTHFFRRHEGFPGEYNADERKRHHARVASTAVSGAVSPEGTKKAATQSQEAVVPQVPLEYHLAALAARPPMPPSSVVQLPAPWGPTLLPGFAPPPWPATTTQSMPLVQQPLVQQYQQPPAAVCHAQPAMTQHSQPALVNAGKRKRAPTPAWDVQKRQYNCPPGGFKHNDSSDSSSSMNQIQAKQHSNTKTASTHQH
jgi:hypothetical protein